MAYHVECGELEPESAAKGPKFQPYLAQVTSPSDLLHRVKINPHLQEEHNLEAFVGLCFSVGGRICRCLLML